MQGLEAFIPTAVKSRYINALLKAGFDTIDFGSFVSPKAIPQMKDTAEVLAQLDLEDTATKLLAIVANVRGAQDAAAHPEIHYLGFPFSISETFQQRNTNKSIAEALEAVNTIQEICKKNNKTLVVYISMGFGNPYGDPYDVGIVESYVAKLSQMGVEIISLADTVGSASPGQITPLYTQLNQQYSQLELGAHFHSQPNTALEKVAAAYQAGCTRFDGAIKGFGGCPMAKDSLTGNIATELMLGYFEQQGADTGIQAQQFAQCLEMAQEVFPA